jgi:hypothetical protein
MKKKNTYILSLEKDDPKKELEFEITFQLSLTSSQRYKRMVKMFKQNMDSISKNERQKTPAIISRA